MSAEEQRWWQLIESSFPSVEQLVAAMRALSRQELLELGVHIRHCRLLIREPWNGPDIPGLGALSEDSTEDFTDWIVSQGQDYWRAANDGGDAHLVACFELYDSVRRKQGHPRAWQPTPVVHLMGTLFTVWLERFEEDRFHDELDAAT